MLRLLNGPQTLGSGRLFWFGFCVMVALILAYPLVANPYDVGNFAYFFIWTFMALGLCLMWGYGGMLSFAQTLFFGVAGYGYGVLAINLGGDGFTTLLALLLSLCLAGVVALVIGYFMIYGRLSGVFFGIVTLAITLAFAAFMNQTAGPEWSIGDARLNGFNGMLGMDPLNIPWFGDTVYVEGVILYFVVVALMLIVYLGLRMLVNSRFGNVLVAIRENPHRAELLGYDIRRFQLIAFVIGSVLAGLSGALYTAWGQFITPTSIGLPAAAAPIVWVAFSGRSDLTATMLGTFVLQIAFQNLTIYSEQYALVFMGLLLLGTVLMLPQGLVVSLARVLKRALGRAGARRVAE